MGKGQNKQTILVVEDGVSEFTALVDKLTQEGFRVFLARDGEEGFAVASKNHPDIILLDIVMPKMYGLTMMKKLRTESTWGKDVPFVLLTNSNPAGDEINQNLIEYEPAYYLIKTDWSMGDVVSRIKSILNKS